MATLNSSQHHPRHTRLRLLFSSLCVSSRLQPNPDFLRALRTRSEIIAERREHVIARRKDEIFLFGRRFRSNQIDVSVDLIAESFQGEVISIITKWVFDFTADSSNAQNDICTDDSARDRDPVKRIPELKGQSNDINPSHCVRMSQLWCGKVEQLPREGLF